MFFIFDKIVHAQDASSLHSHRNIIVVVVDTFLTSSIILTSMLANTILTSENILFL